MHSLATMGIMLAQLRPSRKQFSHTLKRKSGQKSAERNTCPSGSELRRGRVPPAVPPKQRHCGSAFRRVGQRALSQRWAHAEAQPGEPVQLWRDPRKVAQSLGLHENTNRAHARDP